MKPNQWVSLKNYCGLSEVKANFYVNVCKLASKYVASYKNIRMILDD
jgi:hypothetical protein